jgi:hypothetical protein
MIRDREKIRKWMKKQKVYHRRASTGI